MWEEMIEKLPSFSDFKSILLENRVSEELFQQLLIRSISFLKADAATIVRWESDLGNFHTLFQIPQEFNLRGHILTPENAGLDGRLYLEKKVLYLSRYSKNKDVYPPLKNADYEFALGAPIIENAKVTNTVVFYYIHQRDAPTPSEEQIIGEIITFLGIALKIELNDQKHEDLIQVYNRTQNILNLLVNSSPDIIVSIDLNGKVRSWNKAAEKSTGYQEQEIINEKLPLVEGSNEQIFYDHFIEVRNGRSIENQDFLFQSKNSPEKNVHVKLSIIPIKSQSNGVETILIAGKDISEKKILIEQVEEYHLEIDQKEKELTVSKQKIEKMEEELLTSEKLAIIGQLENKLSHQINNPLMVITSCAQLLSEDLKEYNPKRISDMLDYTSTILNQGVRIKDILKQLRIFSEISKDEHVRPTNLAEIVNQVVSEFVVLCKEKNIKLEKKIVRNLIDRYDFNGNFNQIKKVLKILIENSIIAIEKDENSTKKGRIYITTDILEEKDDTMKWILIKINDNGIGISPDDISKIFEPFYIGWEKITQDEYHVGLNLSISELIIKNHKGSITFESGVEHGTTVNILLPQYQNLEPKNNKETEFN